MKTATKLTAYVIQTQMGQVRLFPSERAAMAWEKRGVDRMIVMGCEVSKADHYRGKIPTGGVRFTKEDMSTGQLIRAMNGDNL